MPATGATVELLIGGVWEDITRDVLLRDRIKISRGRAAEGARVDPGKCALTLKNKTGRYSPRNPLSDLYGLIGRGTRLRVSTVAGVRFVGEVIGWLPRTDDTGNDVYVSLTAAGIMRRLSGGSTTAVPLYSALRRTIPQNTALIAYWPMEDGTDATQAASPLPGVAPLATSGLSFGSDSSLPGSDSLPTFGQSGALVGMVPAAADGQWLVEFMWRMDAAPASTVTLLTINTTGTGYRQWSVTVNNSGTVVLHGSSATGGADLNLTVIPTVSQPVFGPWQRVSVEFRDNGTGMDDLFQFSADIPQSGWYSNGTVATASAGHITSVSGTYDALMSGASIGHIAVYNAYDAGVIDYRATPGGYTGETAADRLTRLCGEESIPLVTPHGTANTAAVGPQYPDVIMTLLNDAATADLGILYEARDDVALAFRPRDTVPNQTPALALDYAKRGEVAPPFEPDPDDLDITNDVTANRLNGSWARALLDSGSLSVQTPPDGIGPAPSSPTFNVATDSQLPDIAGWLLHLGTWDAERFPALTVNLASGPWLVPTATAVDSGDLITVANVPGWLAPGDLPLICEGYAEVIGEFDWIITYNCTPGGPWQVGVLDDAVLGRADTAGCVLAGDVAAGDTLLPLLTTDGPLWTQDGAEFPFDLILGGEVVTAWAATGAVVDSFGRTVASGWGSADTGQPWVNAGGSASDFSVDGSVGHHSLGSVNVSRVSTTGREFEDVDLVCSFSTPVLAAGASHLLYLVSRFTGTGDFMSARIELTTSQQVIITIRKRVGGTDTQLSTKTTALTHSAGTLLRARFQCTGTSYQARVWLASAPEPITWDTSVTDASITAAGQVGVRSVLSISNSNTLPVVVTFEDFALLNPQQITAVRGVNGVTKPQRADTDVRLANPMILAL